MKPARRRYKAITDYWLKYYTVDSSTLCQLCANTGVLFINTFSPAGVLVRGKQFCICPNGQAMRFHES
jgi:hypothetical protein